VLLLTCTYPCRSTLLFILYTDTRTNVHTYYTFIYTTHMAACTRIHICLRLSLRSVQTESGHHGWLVQRSVCNILQRPLDQPAFYLIVPLLVLIISIFNLKFNSDFKNPYRIHTLRRPCYPTDYQYKYEIKL